MSAGPRAPLLRPPMTFGSSRPPSGTHRAGGALELGRVAGVPIRIEPTLILFLGVLALGGGMSARGLGAPMWMGAVRMLILLLLLSLAVLLHELGHAAAARREGIEVTEIKLSPFGGVAMMRGMPEEPGVDARVAFAGPLANLVLAAVFGVLAYALLGAQGLSAARFQEPLVDPARLLPMGLSFFAFVNLGLGIANLVPAFPTDGGKLLRALLARKGDWLGATEVAARVGRWIAGALIVSAFVVGNLWLAIIGVYLWVIGMRELWMTRLRHAAGGLGGFGQARGPGGPGGLAEMLRRMAEQSRPGGPGPGPGPGPGGLDSSDEAPAQGAPQDSPQASTWDAHPGGSSHGFSEEDIRRLEESRGRLRRPAE